MATRDWSKDYVVYPDGIYRRGRTAADREARKQSLEYGDAKIIRETTGTTVARWSAGRKVKNNPSKRKQKRSPVKRISAALTRFLRKQNPGKMQGVKHVRVRKLKGGGVSIIPVHGNSVRRRRRK